MKKQNIVKLCFTTFALITLSGCGASNGPTVVSQGDRGVATKEVNGVKTLEYITCKVNTGKKIVINNIKCKSSGCKKKSNANGNMQALLTLAGKSSPDMSGVGDGLGNMLQTSLNKTGCFQILDRESMEELKNEMELSGRKYKPEAADVVISGAVTSISYSKSKKILGGGFVPILGAFAKSETKAKLGIDMKVIDVGSSKIVISKDYRAESGKTKYSALGGAGGFGGGFGGGFSSMNGTSMEEVARDVINRFTYDIVKKFAPSNYKIVTKQIQSN